MVNPGKPVVIHNRKCPARRQAVKGAKLGKGADALFFIIGKIKAFIYFAQNYALLSQKRTKVVDLHILQLYYDIGGKGMQYQPEILAALLSQSDEKLWRAIKTIASTNGIRLPQEAPPKEQMQRLRAALGGGVNLNLDEAARIVERYKKGEQG